MMNILEQRNAVVIFNVKPNTYFPANFMPINNTTEFATIISKKKKEPFRINGAMYSIIGLAAASILFII